MLNSTLNGTTGNATMRHLQQLMSTLGNVNVSEIGLTAQEAADRGFKLNLPGEAFTKLDLSQPQTPADIIGTFSIVVERHAFLMIALRFVGGDLDGQVKRYVVYPSVHQDGPAYATVSPAWASYVTADLMPLQHGYKADSIVTIAFSHEGDNTPNARIAAWLCADNDPTKRVRELGVVSAAAPLQTYLNEQLRVMLEKYHGLKRTHEQTQQQLADSERQRAEVDKARAALALELASIRARMQSQGAAPAVSVGAAAATATARVDDDLKDQLAQATKHVQDLRNENAALQLRLQRTGGSIDTGVGSNVNELALRQQIAQQQAELQALRAVRGSNSYSTPTDYAADIATFASSVDAMPHFDPDVAYATVALHQFAFCDTTAFTAWRSVIDVRFAAKCNGSHKIFYNALFAWAQHARRFARFISVDEWPQSTLAAVGNTLLAPLFCAATGRQLAAFTNMMMKETAEDRDEDRAPCLYHMAVAKAAASTAGSAASGRGRSANKSDGERGGGGGRGKRGGSKKRGGGGGGGGGGGRSSSNNSNNSSRGGGKNANGARQQ